MLGYVLIPVLILGGTLLTQVVCWMIPADKLEEEG